jgi:hypothetical protein
MAFHALHPLQGNTIQAPIFLQILAGLSNSKGL